MSETDLHYLTIGELAPAIEKRTITPVKVTEHVLARIARLDPDLRSYITVTADVALEQARAAEREIASGKYRGALHGVPVAVKDLCDTAGIRTTSGTRVMADRIPARDAGVVARLKAAGAVILGKLNMTEAAYSDNHPDYPPPRNPWNRCAWTGVSSSGSGVAVAAGLCFAAIGTDTGGSIRYPSAMNGLAGIKPTWGRVPANGVFPMAASLDHVGPMCRSVADAALVLAAIAGRDDDDPASAVEPVGDYVSAARAGEKRDLGGLRVGVDHGALDGLDADVVDAFSAAVAVLRDLGADVREVSFPSSPEVVARWSVTCSGEMIVAHAGFFPHRAEDYGPSLRLLLDVGQGLPASEYAAAHLERLAFCGRLARMFDTVDVFACPTVGVRVPRDASVIDPDAIPIWLAAMRFTAPFNFSGSPTISVPCGASADGVPIGFQLVGRHFAEATIIRAAAAYEAATDWHLRHPQLGE
jgi:amidase